MWSVQIGSRGRYDDKCENNARAVRFQQKSFVLFDKPSLNIRTGAPHPACPFVATQHPPNTNTKNTNKYLPVEYSWLINYLFYKEEKSEEKLLLKTG